VPPHTACSPPIAFAVRLLKGATIPTYGDAGVPDIAANPSRRQLL
jgi:hypothetical protein